MRASHLVGLLALVLLVGGFLAVPVAANWMPSAAMATDDGKDKGKDREGKSSEDHDRGHGNEADGVDETTPGKGSRKVAPIGGYTVDVSCAYDEGDDRTTCTFTGVAPANGKKVGFVQVPAEAVCADVTGTSGEWVDPEPHTHVAGYKSKGNDAAVDVTLTGMVSPSDGTGTYWIKVGGDTVPAGGPAIACAEAQADAPAAAPMEPAAPATGTIVVQASACAETPADTYGYDWFAMCAPGGPAVTLTLSPNDPAPGQGQTTNTDGGGKATFGDLTPGEYDLDAVDASWCHAASDDVNAEGKVIADPGGTTTVWIFMCGGSKSGA